MEENTAEPVSKQALEQEEPSLLGKICPTTNNHRKNQMSEYASPVNLSRRRSLGPMSKDAITIPRRRSSSLPLMDESKEICQVLVQKEDLEDALQPRSTSSDKRNKRASSLPIPEVINSGRNHLDLKGRRRRSTSTSSYFPISIPKSIRTRSTNDVLFTEGVRTKPLLLRVEKEDRATVDVIRNDLTKHDIVQNPGMNGSQAQSEDGSGESSYKETTKEHPDPARPEFNHETLPIATDIEHTFQSDKISSPEFQTPDTLPLEQPKLPATLTLTTPPPPNPPCPTLHPIPFDQTSYGFVPPLTLPPTVRPLEMISAGLQEGTMGEENLARDVRASRLMRGGGGCDAVEEVTTPNQVEDISMELEMTKKADHPPEDNGTRILMETNEGATTAPLVTAECSIYTYTEMRDEVEDSQSSDTFKSSSHRETAGIAILSYLPALHRADVKASFVHPLGEARVSEGRASSEHQLLRSTSLSPTRREYDRERRTSRSNSVPKDFKPVSFQPTNRELQVNSDLGLETSRFNEPPIMEQYPDQEQCDNIPTRPHPPGRGKKRKTLTRSTSQGYIQEPEAKKIKLRSTSIDSAVPRIASPDFRGVFRYRAMEERFANTTSEKSATSSSDQLSLVVKDHTVEKEMCFEEAQATLTLAKRGLTIRDAMASFRYPETPRAERTLDITVDLMSSYPSTPALIVGSPGNMRSSPPCQTPTSGERRKKRKAEDEKSRRALKRPFKPPLAPGKVLHRYLGSSSPPFNVNTDLLEDTPPLPSYSSTVLNQPNQNPFPTFETAHSKRYITKRLTKPFKSPSILVPPAETNSDPQSSDPIEPPSSPTRAPTRRRPITALTETLNAPSRSAEMSALESKKQTLTQALKIMNNQDDEARLTQLREQWLAAGREISEKLFSVLPEPTNDTDSQAKGAETYQGYFHDDRLPGPPLADEDVQAEAVARETTPTQKDWTIGSMLEMLSVDPQLFGWNEENEDWQD